MPKKPVYIPRGPGRPRKGEEVDKMRRYQINLPDAIAEAIREFGRGNLAAGVRKLAQRLLK